CSSVISAMCCWYSNRSSSRRAARAARMRSVSAAVRVCLRCPAAPRPGVVFAPDLPPAFGSALAFAFLAAGFFALVLLALTVVVGAAFAIVAPWAAVRTAGARLAFASPRYETGARRLPRTPEVGKDTERTGQRQLRHTVLPDHLMSFMMIS